MERVEIEEGAAFGAAVLAGVGAGVWPTVDAACDAIVRTADSADPIPENVEILRAAYTRFQKIYGALKTIQ